MNPLALVLAGVILNTVAQFLLKAGANRIAGALAQGSTWQTIMANALLDPSLAGGVVCYLLSFVIWIGVLSKMEVGVAYPLLSLGYVFGLVGAFFLFGEQITLTKILGICVIMVGVWLLSRAG